METASGNLHGCAVASTILFPLRLCLSKAPYPIAVCGSKTTENFSYTFLITSKVSFSLRLASLSENETLEVIKKVYEKFSVVLDPHTAIGYGAFDKHNLRGNNIVLATAHPCKFPDAVSKAINLKSDLPKELEFILNEKEDYDIVENNLEKIKNYIIGKTK